MDANIAMCGLCSFGLTQIFLRMRMSTSATKVNATEISRAYTKFDKFISPKENRPKMKRPRKNLSRFEAHASLLKNWFPCRFALRKPLK